MRRTPSFIMGSKEIPFKYTKPLTLSSLGLLLPSAVAFRQRKFHFFTLFFLTSILSANYWRRASYGRRRTADVVMSRFTFGSSIVAEAMRPNPRWKLTLSMTAVTVLLYRMSFYLHARHSPRWIQAHLAMHFIICIDMFIALL
jgi:hypothetical protein